jgi:hypothetical protein
MRAQDASAAAADAARKFLLFILVPFPLIFDGYAIF